MKNTVLVDIDVVIEYLKTGKGVLPAAYEKFTMKVSAVTYTELLASSTFKDAGLEKEVLDFLNKYFDVIEITDAIAIEAAHVLRDSGVSLALALNAAIAKAMTLEILVNDKAQYGSVQGLSFVSM